MPPLKTAFISDIHANLQALEAVLDDLERRGGAERVVCLGDVVGYGGDPVACLDRVRGAGWPTMAGNHDRACVDPDVRDWFNADAAAAVRRHAELLDSGRLAWLRALPERGDLEGALLVHGSPRDPIYEYVDGAAVAAANLRLIGGRLCFHGHTHVPGVFSAAAGRVVHRYDRLSFEVGAPALVNPGSVGQPRDGDPDASYAVWDPAGGLVEFRRVAYDRAGAQAAIRRARLPERFATRLDRGR